MTLKIIDPGMGRTGTNSMKIALEMLGFGPCHHMFEVRDNPANLVPWQAFVRGETMDWDQVFAGFQAQVDWPGAAVWRELADHYPDAKVILTTRSADGWYNSIEKTVGPFIWGRDKHEDSHMRDIGYMTQVLIDEQIFDGKLNDRAHAIDVFNRHNDTVRATIASDRLLDYQLGQGGGPLCDFLGVPVPDAEFPHTNSTTEFEKDMLDQ